MNKTFQSFVFGCRVNEAERIKIDKELVEAGFTVDLTSPSFLIINTCAITGKAEREAKQLINQLRKKHPQAQIVVTGCSATMWQKYQTSENKLADILVPNDQKSRLISLLHTSEVGKAKKPMAAKPMSTASVDKADIDKFRYSNRLLVKIQDGCHRFCSYCIVPYLRGTPQSQSIASLTAYINSFHPVPSEVVLSAINTEAYGLNTGESFISLMREVIRQTTVPRLAFGSIHPWSLTDEFLSYYETELSNSGRCVHFFHVPIQSGSQPVLKLMKREYDIQHVLEGLYRLQAINKNALIATDVIVGFLGETEELFEETYSLLEHSPIHRLHVFRFSNRPHTAAYYMKKRGNDSILYEPTPQEKKGRSEKLIALSKKKYARFLATQLKRESTALVIAPYKNGVRVLLDNHLEGYIESKDYLPGQIVHVTIEAAKDSVAICREC